MVGIGTVDVCGSRSLIFSFKLVWLKFLVVEIEGASDFALVMYKLA